MPSVRIRVLIADDSAPVRKALADTLTLSGVFEVVGEADNGTDAILKVQRLRPDVILMDVHMPRVSGDDATRLIRGVWPGTRVVGISVDGSDETIERMRLAGASTFVRKDAPPDELIAALRTAALR